MNSEPVTPRLRAALGGDNSDFRSTSPAASDHFSGGQHVQSGAATMCRSCSNQPEELLAAAVGSCMMMTILAVVLQGKDHGFVL